MMKCLHVTARHTQSIRSLLEDNLSGACDAQILLEAGAVWLGRIRCHGAETVNAGDTLRVYLRPRQTQRLRLSPEEIVFQDKALLVVRKNPGIPVQGDPASQTHHLSHAVWTHLGSPPNWRPAPITRLDQPVFGLVLFGADAQSEKALFACMRQGLVFKWYRLGLSRRLAPGWRRVELPLAHSGRTIVWDPAGKSACTLFIPGAEHPGGQCCSAFPLTGRRHQIRVHAASVLSPILGDTLYGGPERKEPGIALCCVGLNLTLEGQRYRIRLPREFWQDLE
jgi:23S rRNA-/tRNA-specific pseudouridylate synthase